MPPEWRVQTYFTDLLQRDLRHFRHYLVSFGRELLTAASNVHRIDAMLSANTDYWQDEALRLAGQELGIPFLTLCRENYTIPFDQKTVTTRFRAGKFRYSGTAVAVYSAPTKDVMERSGCFVPDSVVVTGAPRFDRWRDVESLPFAERDCLTIISFASPLYYAPVAFRATEQAVAAAHAECKSKTRIILKIKKQNEADDNRTAAPSLVGVGAEVVADWSLFDLLPRSRAVIGYNSMAVAEGLLADVPVIIPYWGDAIQLSQSMFDANSQLDRSCIYFPRSPDELRDLTKTALTTGLPAIGSTAERLKCFSKVIEAPLDTTSSALVEAFIRRYLPSH